MTNGADNGDLTGDFTRNLTRAADKHLDEALESAMKAWTAAAARCAGSEDVNVTLAMTSGPSENVLQTSDLTGDFS